MPSLDERPAERPPNLSALSDVTRRDFLAGSVAAGGVYALKHHIPRLAEDHENAAALAEALGGIPGVEIINDPVETNIVLFRWETPSLDLPAFRERLFAKGVLLDDRVFPLFRAVTHLGIGRRDIGRAARAIREVLAGGRQRA